MKALLEELMINGDSGKETLYAWFLGERQVIEQELLNDADDMFSIDEINQAFDVAESETSNQYNKQTCTMKDIDGNETCPICYFRARVKNNLL